MSALDASLGSPVCVVGFSRSGTSLTMRLLHLLGVKIGPEEDLLVPWEGDNPRGYWEPRWMVELNDEILDKLGTVWWRPLPDRPGWERSPDFDELRERARRLLKESFGSAGLWGWKDPRTTLTLPFWKQLVPAARYVICLRNPVDAISSIQRRPEPELSIGAWGDLWLEYTARALDETRGCPRALIFYEDFFKYPQKQLTIMASLLDLELPARSAARRRLLAEIELDLRHHATSPHELAAAQGLAPTARAVFMALRAAEDHRRAGSDDGQISEAIERVAPELWLERRASVHLGLACGEAQQTATVLRDELETTCRELESARSELTVSRTHYDQVQTALSGLEDRFERQRAVLDGVHSSVSWRVTAPLRAAKHGVQHLRPARRRSAVAVHDESLLTGRSVSQVWWFALTLSLMIAATDAILTHIVLITLLAAGPFCGMLTGRWARTAAAGIWAVVLAVLLSFPDGIWGTRTQLVDLSTVAVVALLSTLAATFIERSQYRRYSDPQSPL
jgi:hypothetical protein